MKEVSDARKSKVIFSVKKHQSTSKVDQRSSKAAPLQKPKNEDTSGK